ncbi:S-adenosyl-L-methionine-dependent methyltransferase [Amylocystis lapponica]|nr:S-adenosyl-L-methionine-dependent methyltransferase [Amylocystis lapponica]
MSTIDRVQTLRSLVRLLTDASEAVIQEWTAENDEAASGLLPSAKMFEARRTIIGACGMYVDLVSEPQSRLMEVGLEYYTSRALHIAVEGRIADVLADANPKVGMPIKEVAQRVGIQEQKLERVIRTLCTVHIFTEVQNHHFANNSTSQALINNEPLRCWILSHGLEFYTASDKLPTVLFDPVKTNSISPLETAFQEAHHTDLSLWDYFENGIKGPDGIGMPSRGFELFGPAMLGGGRVHAPPLFAGYPWETLGSGTVVDVGGGVGGLSLDLARKFAEMHLIVQDRPQVIEQAEVVWLRELPDAYNSGRVKLMAHDFFKEQPIKGAEVYFMRYILHDWPDDECVAILSRLREAMGPNSRILTADMGLNSTVGSQGLRSAPAPFPPTTAPPINSQTAVT